MHSDIIVLIEDNPDDAGLTKRTLAKCGVNNPIYVIDDGIKAINWIDSLKVPPMLVLLDLGLPGVDGVELLRYLKSTLQTFSIPVVILTGSENEKDRVRGKVIDGNGYLTKPLVCIDFIQETTRIGLYWRLDRKGE